MLKIAPSILSADFCQLAEEIKKIEKAGADLLHLDIMDGHFVPQLTFGNPIIASLASSSNLLFDAHLMVKNPEFYIDSFAQLRICYFSFHYETVKNIPRMIERIKKNKMKAGIALNPETPVSQIIEYLSIIDFVLIMSVHPGFSGQKFIDFSLDKIKILNSTRKNRELKFEIEVDGGINSENIHKISHAGADIIVAGNYIFKHHNYSEAIKSLK